MCNHAVFWWHRSRVNQTVLKRSAYHYHRKFVESHCTVSLTSLRCVIASILYRIEFISARIEAVHRPKYLRLLVDSTI
jgi:hypothetical protein